MEKPWECAVSFRAFIKWFVAEQENENEKSFLDV